MSELIDRNVLKAKMYQEAFESDTDMQKWDSGCWIRYKLFEKVVDSTPTVPYSPRWHRCEDELPDRYDAYVVGWRYPNGCFYWGKVLFFNDKWQVDEEIPTPDYWMPIEPPIGTERKEI